MRGPARSCAFYTLNNRSQRHHEHGGFAYMNAARRRFGNQIDADLRGYAQLPLIPLPELRTVQELLTAIQELRPGLRVPMLKTTASHVSNFLNTPIDRLSIAALVDVDLAPRFRNY